MISFKLRGKFSLSTDRNFIFLFQRIDRLNSENGILSHIIDVNTVVVQIRNTSFDDVFIPKNSRLSIIREYEKKNCYLITADDTYLTANSNNHKSTLRN